jgi:hypothetical protein
VESVRTSDLPATGVDADDAAGAPACLPPTQKNGNWVKREPIRLLPPAELGKVLSATDAARCSHFRIKSAANCAYALRRTQASPATAEVLLIETLSPDDAYGLLTCLCGSTETYKIGGETRVAHSRGLELHCWQGRSYVRLASGEQDAETTEEMIRLLMYVCSRIGRADLPPLVSAMPADGRQPGKLWLVRSLASLPPEGLDVGYPLDASGVAKVLKLGKDTLMCVARYDVPQARRPNTVWVVSYPSIKAALDAYARYARLINEGQDPVARSASVLPAQGTYLIGTWTAEEESLSYVMPEIGRLLPQ